ncbi:unnamed protein product, partial [Rotaria sordida]
HPFSEDHTRDYLINLTEYGTRVSNTHGHFHARNFLISKIKGICSMNTRHCRCELDLQNFADSYRN